MNRFYTFLVSVAFTGSSLAQTLPTFEWNKANGGTGNDKIYKMVVDNNGNTIIAGQFGTTVAFDTSAANTLTSYGIYDIFVAKYNVAGVLQWVHKMSGPSTDNATSVAVDDLGEVYLLADFYDSLDYNPGASGSHTFAAQPGLSDIVFAKFDAAGTLQWAQQIGGPSIDKSQDITIDANKNILITGTFYHTADFNPGIGVDTIHSLGQSDIFMAKYTAAGDFMWVKHIGSPNFETANNIVTDSHGNIFLSGSYYGWCDFDPSPTDSVFLDTTLYGTNLFIEKFDVNGNYIWAHCITSHGFKSIGQLCLDSLGNCYITGALKDSTTFYTATSTLTLWSDPGHSDSYFAKYNSNGECLWAKDMDGNSSGQDKGLSIALDSKGSIYIAGQFWGQQCDFDPSHPGLHMLNSNNSNNYDAYVAKYTSQGDYIWAANVGDIGTDEAVSIEIDDIGNMHIAYNLGQYNNSVSGIDCNFLTGLDDTAYFTTRGQSDFAISKYSQCLINDGIGLNNHTLSSFANGASFQWVNCGIGFAPISGATAQSFTPTISGNYACIVTTNANCSDTTACVAVDLCTGVTNNITVNNTTATLSCSVSNPTYYQWFACDTGGTFNVQIGATSQTFTPTANGSYCCEVKINGCILKSSCMDVTSVGINEIEFENNFRFYPNPAQNIVTVTVINTNSSGTVSVYDMLGNQIKVSVSQNKNQWVLDLSSLSNGAYAIRFTNNKTGAIHSKRFIKQ